MRAERLHRIVDLLRRARHPCTAAQMAAELEVTSRTIYRDIRTLVSMGTPIRGERGVGYVLDAGHDIPVLMFTADELEALVLGARMVAAQADPQTAQAALSTVAKVLAVLPEERRSWLEGAPLFALSFRSQPTLNVDLADIRRAFRTQQKVWIRYRDRLGATTSRTLWPLSMGWIDGRWSVVAWCELREGYRHFRIDRIETLRLLDAVYPGARRGHLAAWRQNLRAEELNGVDVHGVF